MNFWIWHLKHMHQIKNKQLILHQTKNTAKEIIFLMKIQPKEWEKIFTNLISHKQLISKICKELIQLYTRKKKKNYTET